MLRSEYIHLIDGYANDLSLGMPTIRKNHAVVPGKTDTSHFLFFYKKKKHHSVLKKQAWY